ncbi:calcium:proton antiporter [Micromonospora sagamiensis]|uniref:Ca2+:H+ antiporter n=1 Tax=Micromonospora sagamiensis TaxID=47875 RepID=A0A562WGA4_9ACTN|nr:ionic transporter y4hA [Micromonospora sagamiensis]TWJ29202.1 Ca2+:H+ antiporter [Micromonospora sagamiensis]BCL17773.1 ionic transporter y4hA [Micromonospora sagamiensis]
MRAPNGVTRFPALAPATVVPLLAVVALVAVWGRALPAVVEVVVVVLLAGAVLAAVHHAEVVAHRVGEPFGSLILAVAVTVIEVGLIITLMVSGGPDTATLARDTVFAAVMITCNGIVGLSLLLTAVRRRVVVFNPEGTGTALATVLTLATLSLVLPTFTTGSPGSAFTGPQLTFAAVASLFLYATFVFVQNVRHRDYFLPPPRETHAVASGPRRPAGDATDSAAGDDEHAPVPSATTALVSFALLIVALVAVVGLAKVESPTIEAVVADAGLPRPVVGVVIALLVLLPETLAAARNARRDRAQISLNLALGSAMASIGLTIPAIAVASLWLDGPLVLGLGATQIVLLGLTAAVGILTVMPGRATLLQAWVHLALCASYLFLATNP